MEKNFYRDNFEQLLRDTKDNFRMYTSNRFWHSIYNNLHPSRRWPSVAVWLLFIFSVIFIGVANNQEPVSMLAEKAPGNNSAFEKPGFQQSIKAKVEESIITEPDAKQLLAVNNNGTTVINNYQLNSNGTQTGITPVEESMEQAVTESANGKTSRKKNKTTRATGNKFSISAGQTALDKNQERLSTNNTNSNDLYDEGENEINKLKSAITVSITSPEIYTPIAKTEEKQETGSVKVDATNDKEWIEYFAFHNKPLQSKWKSRARYQFYITPSIGYRTIRKNNSYSVAANTSFITSQSVPDKQFEQAVSQAPAVNMELGGSVIYSVSKRVNLKIGVQLNYTNYNINAYELKHPTMTTLLLNDLNTELPILSPRTTTLANTEGVYTTKLNNNTYQFSIPVGAELKIAGNNNLKWYAGATIQPSYILSGNAYFISSDLKNYVTDNSLMRKWNLNGGIETFISYKTKSGIILNAGPQFRYQLLSTYSKQYSYDEKLYNLGLKIGITTRF